MYNYSLWATEINAVNLLYACMCTLLFPNNIIVIIALHSTIILSAFDLPKIR